MYYVRIKRFYSSPMRDISNVNGINVPDAGQYFHRMGDGKIIYDAPLFDYFFLQNGKLEKDWEWKLQDVHDFIGEFPPGGNWYISDKLKQVLENFIIAKEYYFYPTKLLYKGIKLGKINKIYRLYSTLKDLIIFTSDHRSYLKENLGQSAFQ